MTLLASFGRDDVEILSAEESYKGFFSIRSYQVKYARFEQQPPAIATRECFERDPACAVLLYDANRQEVVLLEQFRIGALTDERSPWLLELVAGIVDSGETNEACIKREAYEEAGVDIVEWRHICDYWSSPGGSNEYLSLYCAKVDTSSVSGVHGVAEEHEDILLHVVSAKEAFAAVAQGCIRNAHTIIALQWLQLNQDKLNKLWSE